MNLRRFLAEAGTLVGLSIACALVSNALAGKERKLAVPGDYPNATKVTARPETRPLAPFEAEPIAGAPAPAIAAPSGPSPSNATPVPQAVARPTAPAGAATPPMRPETPKAVPGADLLARFPVHGQPFVEISGEAAAWLHARGAVFLDARRSKDFAEGHVSGARSFPVWEAAVMAGRVQEFVAEGGDPSLPIVLYCSGGDCEDSHMLAQTLFGAGFENLLVYRDGFPDWVKRGGAVRVGGPA
jgi:rhodanese-related sulfurtransferase